MSLRRVSWLAAIALATWLEISCGEVYRPVVIPISVTPPNPANFHAVFGVSANAPSNQGSALQIDVSGDTNIGEAKMGMNPTHAAILPNNSRVFVASAGSLFAGDSDVVTAFTPAADSQFATGLGTPTTYTFPNVGPIDPNTGQPEWFCPYHPDYVTTTQANAVYVASFGFQSAADASSCAPNLSSTDSVALLSTANSTIINISYLPPGAHPVAMAETPNAQNLYVVNQGNGTVADLSPTDLSTIATISVGNNPVWAVARSDNQRVYVLTQGDGKLVPIDTASNAVLPSLSVGAGANFILYDPHLNRLYVTNPGTTDPNNAAVYVFSISGGANDTPTLLKTIPMAAGSAACPNGCSPSSVTALADGSRFYVASYQTQSQCTDPNLGSAAQCMIPALTVFDALSMTVKTPLSSLLPTSLSLLATPQYSATQYALPVVTSCVPAATYAPGTTRFRMFTTAAADSSHVYVSICDAGSIADVNTTTNTVATGTNNAPDALVTDIVAPFGECSGTSCGAVATITAFSISSNIVTFTAPNNFTPGTRVAISGLSTAAGAALNGLTLTVLGSGLTSTTFECNVAQPDVSTMPDAGSAVPLAPLQNPIFLLAGQ